MGPFTTPDELMQPKQPKHLFGPHEDDEDYELGAEEDGSEDDEDEDEEYRDDDEELSDDRFSPVDDDD